MKFVPVFLLLLLFAFAGFSQETATPGVQGKPVTVTKDIDRSELITFAKQYLGTPYRRAGADPKKGFDCSGFVNFVYKHFNLTLPRSSREFKVIGTTLKPEEFKVGDVIVFYGFRDRGHIGHVAIVCEANGMKSRFIHASSGRAHSVTISDLGSDGYRRRFYKCIDVTR
ncbi:MAG: C40 family peptidase [Bacteroidales bacterium]